MYDVWNNHQFYHLKHVDLKNINIINTVETCC